MWEGGNNVADSQKRGRSNYFIELTYSTYTCTSTHTCTHTHTMYKVLNLPWHTDAYTHTHTHTHIHTMPCILRLFDDYIYIWLYAYVHHGFTTRLTFTVRQIVSSCITGTTVGLKISCLTLTHSITCTAAWAITRDCVLKASYNSKSMHAVHLELHSLSHTKSVIRYVTMSCCISMCISSHDIVLSSFHLATA